MEILGSILVGGLASILTIFVLRLLAPKALPKSRLPFRNSVKGKVSRTILSAKKAKGKIRKDITTLRNYINGIPGDTKILWNTKNFLEKIQYGSAITDSDVAAEVFCRNGEVPAPLLTTDYTQCSIDRWNDPDCVPAIISVIYLEDSITFRSGCITHTTNAFAILHVMDKYIWLHTGLEIPEELLETAKSHFQSRGTTKLVDGATYKFDIDWGLNGQDRSAFSITSHRTIGKQSRASSGSSKNNQIATGE